MGPGQAQSGGRNILIGCARARRVDLGAVIEVLSGRGHLVQIVSGLDQTPGRWMEAVQRIGKQGIYLLCGSDELSGQVLENLKASTLRAGIPNANLWAATVDWEHPVIVLRAAEGLMRGVAFPPPAPRPASSVPPPPQTARTSMPRSTPSVEVPVLRDESSDDLVVPVGPVRRFLGSKIGLASIGGLALTLLTITLVAAGGDDEEAAVAADTERPDDKNVAQAEEPAEEPAEKEAAEAEPTVAPAVTPDLEDPSAMPAGSDAPPAEAAAVPPAAVPAAAEAVDELEIEQEQVELPTDDEELVYAALKSRKIRALDILLVAPEAKIKKRKRMQPHRMAWSDADAYCRALEIEGVVGWRLPTVGEFRSLTHNAMLDKTAYWSATKGDAFGHDRLVWDVRKSKMGPAPTHWKGGRVICVRYQRPQDGGPE